MMESGVRKSKHALLYAQHPAPMTISSAGGKYGIIQPWEQCHVLLMMDSCLTLVQVLDIYP